METQYTCELCWEIIRKEVNDKEKTVVIFVDKHDLPPEHVVECIRFPNAESFLIDNHPDFYARECCS